jgi:hypothetical protein
VLLCYCATVLLCYCATPIRMATGVAAGCRASGARGLQEGHWTILENACPNVRMGARAPAWLLGYYAILIRKATGVAWGYWFKGVTGYWALSRSADLSVRRRVLRPGHERGAREVGQGYRTTGARGRQEGILFGSCCLHDAAISLLGCVNLAKKETRG